MTIHGTESITTAALSLALDVAALRHQAIASNLANVNAEGYAPLRVTFNSQFESAQRSLVDGRKLSAASLAGAQAEVKTAGDATGVAPVRLDVEMAALAQNTTHYQVLLRGLSRHLSLLASAVSEGRK